MKEKLINYLKHPFFAVKMFYRKLILGQNIDVQRLRIDVLLQIEMDESLDAEAKQFRREFVELWIPEIARYVRMGMNLEEATKQTFSIFETEGEDAT